MGHKLHKTLLKCLSNSNRLLAAEVNDLNEAEFGQRGLASAYSPSAKKQALRSLKAKPLIPGGGYCG